MNAIEKNIHQQHYILIENTVLQRQDEILTHAIFRYYLQRLHKLFLLKPISKLGLIIHSFVFILAVPTPCSKPSTPSDGNAPVCTNDPINSGDSCTFSCLPNFELSGTATITCQSDGTFDDVPPTCSGNILYSTINSIFKLHAYTVQLKLD